MDTFTLPEPNDFEPVPTREARGEGPSRLRVLATSVAVAGLTATGGLAVILSTAATSGATPPVNVSNAAPAGELPQGGDTSGTTRSTTTITPNASSAPGTGTTPNANAAPGTTQNGSATQPQGGPGQFGGQPPQFGQGSGPGHASSGGS